MSKKGENPSENGLEEFSTYEVMKELKDRQRNYSRQERSRQTKGMEFTSSKTISTRKGIRSYSTKDLINYAKKRGRLIYGVDDRKDYYELESDQKQECDGVVSLFEKSDIQEDGDGKSRIQTSVFAEAYGLCEQEIFRDQPVGAFCSGFLVAEDIVATAGHCVDKNNVTDVCFVFGYRMNKSNQAQTSISSSDIYRGKEIIGRKLEAGNGSDWCLVRLDRPVVNHKIFNLRRSGKIENGEKVHVIGHPCGLPLKYAGGAWVRSNEDDAYFVANLDTYGGNSGSCVIADKTGQVEGILVRGDTDFVPADGCNVSNVCPTTGCRGEDITRTTEFADLVPE
jgi:V8-like Glu-specific endopeptidase